MLEALRKDFAPNEAGRASKNDLHDVDRLLVFGRTGRCLVWNKTRKMVEGTKREYRERMTLYLRSSVRGESHPSFTASALLADPADPTLQ